MDHANRGEAALKASNYDDAIAHYTKAIQDSPEAATYHLKRSIAYQRRSKYEDALIDSENAVYLAVKRAKRELIAQAQLRRGIAMYHLENYGNAHYCFDLAKQMDNTEKSVVMWQAKAEMKLKELGLEDPRTELTCEEYPEFKKAAEPAKAPTAEAPPAAKPVATKVTPNGTSATTSGATKENDAPSTTTTTPAPPAKIRHDWYQTNDNVVLDILAKGVSKTSAIVQIEPTSLSISFPTATGSTFDFSLDPLFARIDASNSTYRVLSTKIEVTLKKELAGQRWPALENDHPLPTAADEAISLPPKSNASAGVPSPYSSGPKNWDTIASESLRAAATPKPSNPDTTDDGPSDKGIKSKGNLDEDDDEGDDVNKFFKHLFKNADPDTRKAMVKSYTESGGTALSTNWDEVGKKRVEISPPDGMEAKAWGT
jgi:suppressor of G2 allele of SKP1